MLGFASTGSSRARSAAFGFAAFSMAAFGSPAAFAKEPIAPACLSAGSEFAQLRCSIALSKKATANWDAHRRAAVVRGVAADARGAAEDKRTAQLTKSIETASAAKSCFDGILQEVQAAKLIAPLTPAQKNAFKARAAECEKS